MTSNRAKQQTQSSKRGEKKNTCSGCSQRVKRFFKGARTKRVQSPIPRERSKDSKEAEEESDDEKESFCEDGRRTGNRCRERK